MSGAIGLSDIQIGKISDATRTAQLSQSADRFFFGIDTQIAKEGPILPPLTKNAVSQGADDKIDRLRQLVTRKTLNAQGSQLLAKSRHFHQDSSQKSERMTQKFLKRKQEVDTLVALTCKIKDYIKANKKTLLKQRNDIDKQIFQIEVNKNPKLRETLLRKHSMSSGVSSFLTETDEIHEAEEHQAIPDERDWRRGVIVLKQKVGDFNIMNYVKQALTAEEQAMFNQAMKRVPEQNRVYMQL